MRRSACSRWSWMKPTSGSRARTMSRFDGSRLLARQRCPMSFAQSPSGRHRGSHTEASVNGVSDLWTQTPSSGESTSAKLGNEEVSLSFTVFPKYRRRGIAVEASKLAIDYASCEMGAKRVIVKMLQENDVSLAVAGRLGAKPSGTGPSDSGGTFLINVIDLT